MMACRPILTVVVCVAVFSCSPVHQLGDLRSWSPDREDLFTDSAGRSQGTAVSRCSRWPSGGHGDWRQLDGAERFKVGTVQRARRLGFRGEVTAVYVAGIWVGVCVKITIAGSARDGGARCPGCEVGAVGATRWHWAYGWKSGWRGFLLDAARAPGGKVWAVRATGWCRAQGWKLVWGG